MRQLDLAIIHTVACVGLAFLVANLAACQRPWQVGEKVTIKGKVLVNDHHCFADGPNCSLTLRVRGRKITVIYGIGWHNCKNQSISSQAAGFKPGDKVEVYAQATGSYSLDACDLEDSWVRPLTK